MEKYKHLREHVVDFALLTSERRGLVGADKLEKVVNKGSDANLFISFKRGKIIF